MERGAHADVFWRLLGGGAFGLLVVRYSANHWIGSAGFWDPIRKLFGWMYHATWTDRLKERPPGPVTWPKVGESRFWPVVMSAARTPKAALFWMP